MIGDRWALLAADGADQLGGYRIGELTSALTRFGGGRADVPRRRRPLARLRDGGHAAAWRASVRRRRSRRDRRRARRDHPGTAPARRRHLRPERRLRTPDHIRAHEVTTAAVAAAGGSDHPGEPWSVPKFYWTVIASSAIDAGLRELADVALPEEWTVLSPGEFPFGFEDDRDRRRRRRARESGRQGGRASGARDAGHGGRARTGVRAVERLRPAHLADRALRTRCTERQANAMATAGRPTCWPD